MCVLWKFNFATAFILTVGWLKASVGVNYLRKKQWHPMETRHISLKEVCDNGFGVPVPTFICHVTLANKLPIFKSQFA